MQEKWDNNSVQWNFEKTDVFKENLRCKERVERGKGEWEAYLLLGSISLSINKVKLTPKFQLRAY